MAAVSQPKPSALDRRTINVTDPRTETREILENAHFRGWHYIVHRRAAHDRDFWITTSMNGCYPWPPVTTRLGPRSG